MAAPFLPRPPELVAVLNHTRACPLCSKRRNCPTGVALAARWLAYEQQRRTPTPPA